MQHLPKPGRYYRHYFLLYPFAVETVDLRQYDVVLSSCFGYAKGVHTRRDALQQIGLALVGGAGARLATVPGLQAGQTTLLGLIRRMFPQDHAVIACLAGRQEQGSQN